MGIRPRRRYGNSDGNHRCADMPTPARGGSCSSPAPVAPELVHVVCLGYVHSKPLRLNTGGYAVPVLNANSSISFVSLACTIVRIFRVQPGL